MVTRPFTNETRTRSKEWGVSPPHWYWTSALPRSLQLAYPLSFLGAWLDRRARPWLAVALAYVGIYSLLPHKELRFLFPALPLFTLCAAAGAQVLANRARKLGPWARRGAAACVVGVLTASILFTGLTAACSFQNYPGGEALVRLNDRLLTDPRWGPAAPVRVHIGNDAAISGVSRFLQLDESWISYSKVQSVGGGGPVVRWSDTVTCASAERGRCLFNSRGHVSKQLAAAPRACPTQEEGLSPEQLAAYGFDYLLSGWANVPGCRVIDQVHGFDRVKLDTGAAWPIRVQTAPKIWIHRCEWPA